MRTTPGASSVPGPTPCQSVPAGGPSKTRTRVASSPAIETGRSKVNRTYAASPSGTIAAATSVGPATGAVLRGRRAGRGGMMSMGLRRMRDEGGDAELGTWNVELLDG